jgi:hypothetical protein
MIATAAASGVLSLTILETNPDIFSGQMGVHKISAAVLSTELLANVQATNDSGTTSDAPFDRSMAHNVNFTISGQALADVSAVNADNKVAVLAVPDDLIGKVTANGDVTTDTAVTLRLNQIPVL